MITQASWKFDNTIKKKRVDEGYTEKNLKSSGYWNPEFKIHIDNNWSETEFIPFQQHIRDSFIKQKFL